MCRIESQERPIQEPTPSEAEPLNAGEGVDETKEQSENEGKENGSDDANAGFDQSENGKRK